MLILGPSIPCILVFSLMGCSLLDWASSASLYFSGGMLTLGPSIPCILVLSLEGCSLLDRTSHPCTLSGWMLLLFLCPVSNWMIWRLWNFLLIIFIYKLNIFVIFIYKLNIFAIFSYIIMSWWSHHSMHVGVRERPVGVDALLALCQAWGSGGFVCWDILSEPQSLEALLTWENSLYSRNGSVLGLVLHTSFLICNCLFFLESFKESEIISMRSRLLSLVKSSVPVLPNSNWCSTLCLWSL